MDDRILLTKKEFEQLQDAFNRLSEEHNLRIKAEESLNTATEKLDKQLQIEEQLRLLIDSQEAILNNAAYMVITTDCEGNITTFNPASERALGYTAAECIGMQTPVIFHDPGELAERAGIFSAELGFPVKPGFEVFAVKARLNLPNEYEWTYIRKDGSRFPVLLSVTALYGKQGYLTGFLGIANDITESKLADEAQRRLNRELRAISNCNQVLMRADDEQMLLNDICQIICNEAGYRMTWVGYAEHDEEMSVRAVAHAGIENGYLESANIIWANAERGRGPSGTAIRTGESACIQDFTIEPQAAPWRESALQRGYRSSIALPLKDENTKVFGVLNIYSTESNAFTPDEIRLLEELATDLAFGIAVLRNRTERKQAEELIRKREAEFRALAENIPDHIIRYDSNCRAIYINHQQEQERYSVSSLIGTIPMDHEFAGPVEIRNYQAKLQRVIASGEPEEMEINVYELTGINKVFEVHFVAERNESGEIIGAMAIGRDITEQKQAEADLRRSEERYRMVFEHSPVSIWEEDFSGVKALFDDLKANGITDIESYFDKHPETIRKCADLTKIIDVNRAALALHEASDKEELMAGLANTFTPESFEAFRKELICLWNEETEITIDTVVKTLTGDLRNVSVFFSVCPGYSESLSKVLVSLINITESKQAEEALRESEEKYRTLIQKIQTAVIVHSADTKIITCNAKAQELLGLTEDQLLGKTSIDPAWHFYREDGANMSLKEYPVNRVMATQQALRDYIVGVHRSDKENDVWVLVNADPVFDKKNQIAQVIVTFIDITKRKQAEEALRKSETLLNITQQLSKVGGWEFSVELGKSFWTEEVYRIHEISADAGIDHIQESLKCYRPEDRAIVNDAFRGVVERGEAYDLEFPFTTFKGRPLWVRTTAQPVYEKGKVVRIIGNIMDITERKLAEESREKERKRMEVLLSALNTGLSLINPDMTIAWVNQKIREMFPGREPVGQICHVFYESRDTICDGCGTLQAFRTGEVIESEQIVPSTGQWYYIISQPIKDKAGHVVNVLEGITDITERKQAEQKLKLLNFALNNVYDEAFLINKQACFHYVNDESCRALGYSREELLGMNVSAIDPDFPLELWPQHWSDIKEHGSTVFESHHKTKDGRIYPVEISANYFEYNGQGYNLALARDITERKQAEEELKKYHDQLEALVSERTKQLRESEFYYRRLFETMFQGVVYQDTGGKIISMNPAAELILGKTQSEFLGKTSVDTENKALKEDGSPFAGDEHPAIVALNTGREVQNVVMKLYNPSVNGYRWINISAMPLFHPDETKPYQVYSLFNDITERKEAEEALRVSEERMRLFFERQLVGMAITSPEKGWVKVNDKICEMLGYPREELTQLTWSEMTYPDDLAQDVSQFERLLRDEIEGYTMEKRFIRKDGSLIFTNLAVGCVRRPDRTVNYVLAILEDITGRKQADNQIRRLNEQLATHAQSLEQANKELEAFSYSVSHDLRAPLRSIDGFSQILLDEYQEKIDEQGKDYLRRVRFATQRMAQLIDDMLNLSRVSRGEMNIQEVNISRMVQEITDDLQGIQPERKVEFIIQEGIKVRGDGRLLRIVLENLIGNAWKFTSKHPAAVIEFGMQQQNERPVYFIRDNGAGFNMEYAQKLFGAFQRLHAASEFPGTGVGLATVQRVIHRHGGKVWAEGEVEKGATFYFTI